MDKDFRNDPFFECLQRNDFNPFSGEFTGRTLGSYGFEELDAGFFHDHSGINAHSSVVNASSVYGRIGSALQVKRSSVIEFPAKDFESGRQIFLDFHLNLGSALPSNAWRTVLRSNNDGVVIEYRPINETI